MMSETFVCPYNGFYCVGGKIFGNVDGHLIRRDEASYCGRKNDCRFNKPKENPECKMTIKKCLGCPAARKVPAVFHYLNQNIMFPFTLICEVTNEEIKVTKCIKEA